MPMHSVQIYGPRLGPPCCPFRSTAWRTKASKTSGRMFSSEVILTWPVSCPHSAAAHHTCAESERSRVLRLGGCVTYCWTSALP